MAKVWDASTAPQPCLEYDLDYKVSYEKKLTPFELGPASWLCNAATLPAAIFQDAKPRDLANSDKPVNSLLKRNNADGAASGKKNTSSAIDILTKNAVTVEGRSIHLRDHYSFPLAEAERMEHNMILVIGEESLFRAAIYQTTPDITVRMKVLAGDLAAEGQRTAGTASELQEYCAPHRNEGLAERQSVFCRLDPGKYVLRLTSEYTLGGVHPCQYFQFQLAIRPLSLIPTARTANECSSGLQAPLQPLEQMEVLDSPLVKWRATQFPLVFRNSDAKSERESARKDKADGLQVIWERTLQVSDDEVHQKVFLKLGVNSDFLTADARFSLAINDEELVEPVLVSSGYSNLIELERTGKYRLRLYFLTGSTSSANRAGWISSGAPPPILCPKFQVDFRVLHRDALKDYKNKNAMDAVANPYGSGSDVNHEFENTAKDPMSNTFSMTKETLSSPHALWLCKVGLPSLPSKITAHMGEPIVLDSLFILPFTGLLSTVIYVPEEFLLKVQVRDYDAGIEFSVKPYNPVNNNKEKGWSSSTPQTGTTAKDSNGPGVYQISEQSENWFLAVLSPQNPNNANREVSDDNKPNEVKVLGFELTLKVKKTGVGKKKHEKCPKLRVNLVLQPFSATPECPRNGGARAKDFHGLVPAELQKMDHTGLTTMSDVDEDLVDSEAAHDAVNLLQKAEGPMVDPNALTVSKSFWMDAVHDFAERFRAGSEASIRVEAVVTPPWLPLKLNLWRIRGNGEREKAPLGKGVLHEQRLLLLKDGLEKGEYELEIATMQSRNKEMATSICAHVAFNVLAVLKNDEDREQLRTELVDVPDLFAVVPFPRHFNQIGLYDKRKPTVTVGIYSFTTDNDIGSTLKIAGTTTTGPAPAQKDEYGFFFVTEPTYLRVAGEPADLVQTKATLAVLDGKKNVVADVQDNLFDHLVLLPNAGNYQIMMTAAVAYQLTFAFAGKKIADDMAVGQHSSESCPAMGPGSSGILPVDNLQGGGGMSTASTMASKDSWALVLPRQYFRQTFASKVVADMKLKIGVSSLLHMEIGGNFLIDHAAFAVEIPEGSMMSEHRGYSSRLELELDPGEYKVQLLQKIPSGRGNAVRPPEHCAEFSANMWLVPLKEYDGGSPAVLTSASSSRTKGDSTSAELDIAAVEDDDCEDPQAVPLPFDLGPGGGSESIGGPINTNTAQLLIRSRVVVTDLHDGRKKVFLPAPTGNAENRRILIKIEVQHLKREDRDAIEFAVSEPKQGSSGKEYRPQNHVEPLELLTTTAGWAAYYSMDTQRVTGYWLTFHHTKQSSAGTNANRGCMLFDFALETRPEQDLPLLTQCQFDSVGVRDVFPQFPPALNLPFKHETGFKSVREAAEDRVLVQGSFTLKEPAWFSYEVRSSFVISHMQLLVHDKNGELADGDLMWSGQPGDALTVKKWLGILLDAGTYMMEFRDELWDRLSPAKQWIRTNEVCVPISVSVFLVGLQNQPSILSVLPMADYPLCATCNEIQVRLQFSQPIGNVENYLASQSPPLTLNGVPPKRLSGDAGNVWSLEAEDDGLAWVVTFANLNIASAGSSGGSSSKMSLAFGPTTANLFRRVVVWENNGQLPTYSVAPKTWTAPLWVAGRNTGAVVPSSSSGVGTATVAPLGGTTTSNNQPQPPGATSSPFSSSNSRRGSPAQESTTPSRPGGWNADGSIAGGAPTTSDAVNLQQGAFSSTSTSAQGVRSRSSSADPFAAGNSKARGRGNSNSDPFAARSSNDLIGGWGEPQQTPSPELVGGWGQPQQADGSTRQGGPGKYLPPAWDVDGAQRRQAATERPDPFAASGSGRTVPQDDSASTHNQQTTSGTDTTSPATKTLAQQKIDCDSAWFYTWDGASAQCEFLLAPSVATIGVYLQLAVVVVLCVYCCSFGSYLKKWRLVVLQRGGRGRKDAEDFGEDFSMGLEVEDQAEMEEFL
ncbi:unnamed protein product [Amoebophrya sp. A120]|nr:unnamed protein product [Amoebophrya sp. A120]|eukprot:GSA120T00005386001.1